MLGCRAEHDGRGVGQIRSEGAGRLREVSPLDLVKCRVTFEGGEVAVWVIGIRLAGLNVLFAPFREAEPRPAGVVCIERLEEDSLVDELEEDLEEPPLILPSNRW